MNCTKRINTFIWAEFVDHWDLLLRDCSERREKEAQKMTTQKNVYKNAYCPTNKASVTNKISRYAFWRTRSWIGPLINAKKYNLTKRTTKIEKYECLKMYIINFNTKAYKPIN